jgi:hypothetical protein
MPAPKHPGGRRVLAGQGETVIRHTKEVSVTVLAWLVVCTDVAPAGSAVDAMATSAVVDSVCVAMEVIPSDCRSL